LRKRRAYLLRIAADPSLYTVCEGSEAIVQHARSGLRAQFTVAADGMGDVFSKPYELGGVRLIGDSPGDWQTYVGFGIGAIIYRRGADFFPDVRWRVQATSDYSYGLRRKLHADDPWRWGTQSCSWCDANGGWENLRQEDMVAHPPAGQLS